MPLFGKRLPRTSIAMANELRKLIPHALVIAIDAMWGWAGSTYGKPWLFELLDRHPWKALQVFDGLIQPGLWISYAVVLTAQMVWVMLVTPRDLSLRRLQQLWWMGFGISLASALAVQLELSLPSSASMLVFAAQLIDLTLLYWLSTALLTPAAKRRSVIPGWG